MNRYICVHGHFYQPPRENPWLEDVELQDSAFPYHDWNERITAECYEPNTVSRILDEKGWIRSIHNNYAKISFNFGPTLLSWMEKKEPDVYQAIIDADRESRKNFSGHGSALAQAYNHIIMPLASRRDKETQIIWGIKDFMHRFGRRPEGMWLPETAVDLETLEIMSEHGVKFIILSPYQALHVRRIGSSEWQWAQGGMIDTTMPYLIPLSNPERSIKVFFYNGQISQAVAFERLLASGEGFARRLLGAFNNNQDRPQLVSIATDGETYGHHHRHGDMALAFALNYIESNNLARLTNYGEYLELHPPTHEVEICENSAWSCAHGIERWRNDCGCSTGLSLQWSQAWRQPVRRALDQMRDVLAPLFYEEARRYLNDPWSARNDYIELILDRSPESLHIFLERHQVPAELDDEARITVLKLMELQRHAMLMYTSCGWFFDDIAGIETIQIIKYAGRVIQLARELFARDLEHPFLETLELAKSNTREYKNGAEIYQEMVRPKIVDLAKVGAHYAICSLFDTYEEESRIYCYLLKLLENRDYKAGAARLVVGRVRVTSEITLETADIFHVVISFGSHNINAGVQVSRSEEEFQTVSSGLVEAFERADYPELFRFLDHSFTGAIYTFKQLFRDRQRMILELILDATLQEVAEDYQRIYERHIPLMRFLRESKIPQPRVLHTAAEFILNANLRRLFGAEKLDLKQIKELLSEARMSNIRLDTAVLGYVLQRTLERMGAQLLSRQVDCSLIGHLDEVAGLVRTLPFEVDLWRLQNIYYLILQETYPQMQQKATQGQENARLWLERFNSLGDKLKVWRDA